MTGSFTATESQVQQAGTRRTGWVYAPVVATVVMLVAMFLHLALTKVLPNNTFVGLLTLVVLTALVWMNHNPYRLRGVGAVEWAMVLYLMWNLYSVLLPHKYEAMNPLTGKVYSVPQFIMTAVVIPFVMYAVGRYTFDRKSAVRALFYTILAASGYSAWVSILQFTGPKSWVWPRFIVDGSFAPGETTWADRALGVFNQPVVNGLVMALGIATAMLLMSRRDEPRWLKVVAFVVAVGSGYGVYLTHTRAAWLSAAVVLILGALLGRGFRRGFVITLGLVATFIAINWSVFTSSDRKAGGIGSEGEVNDRLNMIATALWAFAHKPITGWGLLRFQSVNTYHHQQWAVDVPWFHGYGIAPHENEMGILAELGLIGLVLWVAVLVLVARRLIDAYRTLPDSDLCGRPLAVIAIIAFAILVCTGFTVDLRPFDFPTAVVFLLIGTAVGFCDRYKHAQPNAADLAVAPLSKADA